MNTLLIVAMVALVCVDLTENHKTRGDTSEHEESIEYNMFNNVFDLRGTLRQRLGLVAALKDPEVDAVCSPVSALLALGKLAIGAHGAGLKELHHAIGVKSHHSVNSEYEDYDDGDDEKSLKTHLMGIIENLESLPDVTLDLANKLYVSENKKIYKNFTKVATRIFTTAVENANFSNPSAAVASINNWVSFQTHGMITDLLSSNDVTYNTSVVMVNAIYFAGKWKYTFDKVELDVFYTPKGIRNVPMMSVTQWYNYVDSKVLSAQLIEIPYVGKKCSFLIVLPKKKNKLELLLKQMKKKPELLGREMRSMQAAHIKLSIPKFKIESQWDLKNLLKKIGMRAIFKKGSGLTGIVRKEELEVSTAIQKAVIEVSETGTEASASTTIINLATMFFGGIDLKVDHPFLFYVMANAQQLFSGIYI